MKNRLKLIGLLIVGIIVFPILNELIVIRSTIYYTIDYDVKGSNREEIINKIEMLNYTVYLNNFRDDYYDFKSFVDRDFVAELKSRIEKDIKIHWEIFYRHSLRYSFIAENHSELYLTYNNNSIFSVKDQNNNSLFLLKSFYWNEPAWYLNFTQLPDVYGDNFTMLLSNAIFIEIHLDYNYYCGNVCALNYSIDQFIVLNTSLDVLMIFIPYPHMSVA